MTIRLKLTILSIAGILVANALVSLAVFSYIQSAWLREVQNRVQLDLRSARALYEARVQHVEGCLQAAALNPDLITATSAASDPGSLVQQLIQVRRVGAMDFLLLLDAEGHVLAQAEPGTAIGNDLSRNALIAAAVSTHQPATGTVRVPAVTLRTISNSLAARARIDLMPTREAEPTLETTSSDGLVLAAAVPLLGEDGALQGLLYGGDLLNRRDDLVDSIRDAVFCSPVDSTPSLDTVTIFLEDVRIATNVRQADGQRAIGTRMSRKVAEEVLDRGEVWTRPAFVVNDWYVTAYEPIRDPQHQVVGSLYVGLLQAPFLQQRNTLAGVVSIMVLSGTMACFLLIYFMNFLVLRPASKVIDMARRVIQGDLTARVGIRPPGEIGVLCQAVDQMADALAEREEQLKTATGKQLHRSEKLASLGRLAAGVAHEINNPLTGVLTFAHLMKEKSNMDDQDLQDLDLIIHETTRAAEIVSGLLDFARERAVIKEPLNLNEVIVRTIRLIRNQKMFERIAIDEDLANDLPDIEGDMNQLQQVLLNLSLNACEAMPQGGTLTVRTRSQQRGVMVILEDTGGGIAPEHLERVFDPFFTTKPVGKGTGLGLSVSYGIVRQHGGMIEFDSQPRRGTTVILIFPALGQEPVVATAESVPREHPFLATAE
ncbi:MAG: HAMP domain-containing protein [Planctomycetaceae bacterium]|nr:MAG: HAMP domain-containing protein [Planctomycetaceae bacterium]